MTEPEPNSRPLSYQDRMRLRAFRQSVQLLVSMHRRMTIPQAITFLQVMATEGLTVSALATYCGVEQHTISKHLRDLGPCDREGQPSLDLITTVGDPYDGRLRHVVLTEHGVAVGAQLASIMRRAQPRRVPSPTGSPAKTDASP